MTAREFFDDLPGRPDPERLRGIHHTYLFDIAGEGRWLVTVDDGNVTVDEDPESEAADVSFTLSGETFTKLAAKEQNPMIAYMTGKLKISRRHQGRDGAPEPAPQDGPVLIHGAVAAALTPLRSGGAELDADAFEPYMSFLADGGVDGILAFGTTGEGILFASTSGSGRWSCSWRPRAGGSTSPPTAARRRPPRPPRSRRTRPRPALRRWR